MSKLLLLLRHAKSAWPTVPDLARPLAARARTDAPRTGRWLYETGRIPDLVVCSPARRAEETWQLAESVIDGAPPVTYDDRIYDAGVGDLLRVIGETPPTIETLLLVGHEPGVSDLTLRLAKPADGDVPYERARVAFPTCALAVLEVEGDWADLRDGCAVLTDFVTPRTLDT